MPDVLEFASQHMTGLHRQIGMFALNGLHASQLIQADGALSAPGVLRSLSIHLTAVTNLLVPLCIGNLGQPVPEAVRLQSPFLSR